MCCWAIGWARRQRNLADLSPLNKQYSLNELGEAGLEMSAVTNAGKECYGGTKVCSERIRRLGVFA